MSKASQLSQSYSSPRVFADTTEIQAARAIAGRVLELITGQRYEVGASDLGGGLLMVNGLYANLLQSGSINFPSLSDLGTATLNDGQVYNITGFYPSTEVGGGQFVYRTSEDKANHNGGTIIDPVRIAAWDGTIADLSALFTAGAGTGCYVRVVTDGTSKRQWDAAWFGTSTAVVDSALALNQALSSIGFGVVMAGSGTLYLSAGVVIIPDNGVELEGVAVDQGRSAYANFPTRLIWLSGAGALVTIAADARKTRISNMTIDCQNAVGVTPLEGLSISRCQVESVTFRLYDTPITLGLSCFSWEFNNCEFFGFSTVGVDLTGLNHFTTFYRCTSENTGASGVESVVRIGSATNHCSNVNFISCDFEPSQTDYFIDARNVRALNIQGGYFECPAGNLAVVKLGDTALGTTCEGFSMSGVYIQIGVAPYAIDINQANSVSITGNHFRSVNTAVLKNPNGCPNSTYKSNYEDGSVFAFNSAAIGFDDVNYVGITMTDDTIHTIPFAGDYARLEFYVSVSTLVAGSILIDNVSTAGIAILSSNGTVNVSTSTLTGTTGPDGAFNVACNGTNIYLENRLGGTSTVQYTLSKPTAKR